MHIISKLCRLAMWNKGAWELLMMLSGSVTLMSPSNFSLMAAKIINIILIKRRSLILTSHKPAKTLRAREKVFFLGSRLKDRIHRSPNDREPPSISFRAPITADSRHRYHDLRNPS